MIRVTIQIDDEQDENKSTVISAGFDYFDEVPDFIKKARIFDGKERSKDDKKTVCKGFSQALDSQEKGDKE